jgi:hypothetical protein
VRRRQRSGWEGRRAWRRWRGWSSRTGWRAWKARYSTRARLHLAPRPPSAVGQAIGCTELNGFAAIARQFFCFFVCPGLPGARGKPSTVSGAAGPPGPPGPPGPAGVPPTAPQRSLAAPAPHRPHAPLALAPLSWCLMAIHTCLSLLQAGAGKGARKAPLVKKVRSSIWHSCRAHGHCQCLVAGNYLLCCPPFRRRHRDRPLCYTYPDPSPTFFPAGFHASLAAAHPFETSRPPAALALALGCAGAGLCRRWAVLCCAVLGCAVLPSRCSVPGTAAYEGDIGPRGPRGPRGEPGVQGVRTDLT